MQNSRLGGADGVRALACLMVMGHHAFQRLNLYAQNPEMQEWQLFFLTGSAGVGVFFVLSGYLLSSPFWKAWGDGREQPSLGTYALRRWARIAPAFWVNLTLTFALSMSFFPGAPDLVWRFLAGLTFTSSFTWQTLFPVEINGPLWSIGYEVVSYALLALFLFLWFKLPGKRSAVRGLLWWTAVFALALAVHGLMLEFLQTDRVLKGWEYGMSGGAKYWWPAYNPVGFFATFVIGVFASGVSDLLSRKSWSRSVRWFGDAFVLLVLTLTAWMLWELRHEGDFAFSWPTQPYYFPSFALLVGAVLAVSPHTNVMAKLLDNPLARFIVTISFGLYIWHYLFLEGSRLIWPDVQYFGIADLGTWAWKIALIYGAAAITATLSWYSFERPLVMWSQRKSRVL